MQYEVSESNIHLKLSYEVSKGDFEQILVAIREQYPDCLVWNRSVRSLLREWATHNAFHAIGFLRNKTADTDLNWPQKWYIQLGYAIAGAIVWPFIK